MWSYECNWVVAADTYASCLLLYLKNRRQSTVAREVLADACFDWAYYANHHAHWGSNGPCPRHRTRRVEPVRTSAKAHVLVVADGQPPEEALQASSDPACTSFSFWLSRAAARRPPSHYRTLQDYAHQSPSRRHLSFLEAHCAL